MSTSSSSAAERELLKKIFIVFVISFICFLTFFLNHNKNNKFIIETIEFNGSAKEGYALFKINCVGCHGITARGLVGPDLHSITKRLNDKEIIKQVTGGLTPPMPSFEIDPVNMSNLLKYLHSLE
ncbi:MAG: cytochrome c [Prochlorococcus marinus CUG1439]|uniref:cytochrome c n=1 Tax=Prochlorococcus sp. MIT 1314 TaxID=3096220 RepID=UPI001B0D9DE0|nr:cytochrome c [Prochlorococcus sp. MIT 1314]MCR8540413.1 cytochrome c [Prochlorococcus marinus CUG1439]